MESLDYRSMQLPKKDYQGFSILEFLVAITIIALVGSSFTLLLGTSLSKLTSIHNRTLAYTAAHNVLETADAFHCGLVIGTESPADLTAVGNNCWLSPQYSTNSTSSIPRNPVGTSAFNYRLNNKTYSVEYLTSWYTGNAQNELIKDSILNSNHQPTALSQVVKVSWKDARNKTQSIEVNSLSLVPDQNKFVSPQRALLVAGVTPSRVYKINNSTAISSGSNNYIWVPFLQNGAQVELTDTVTGATKYLTAPTEDTQVTREVAY